MSGIVEARKKKTGRKGKYLKEILFYNGNRRWRNGYRYGSALGTALRGHNMIIFEYDNGGYMNTGYQRIILFLKGAKVLHPMWVPFNTERHF